MLALTDQISALLTQIAALVKAGRSTLTELYGVGPVVAATIIGHVFDIRRYPTRHHFATVRRYRHAIDVQRANWCLRQPETAIGRSQVTAVSSPTDRPNSTESPVSVSAEQ